MNNLYQAKKLFFALLLMILSTSLLAQIPQQLNYQGALRDTKGFPIGNRAITLRLSILDNGGPNALVLYSEVRQVTTNAVGLYNLAIGSQGAGQVSGNFSQINWAIGAKFIKVEIDADGGANFSLAGISPLLSVPYALYAKYAENGPVGPQGPAGPTGPQGPIGLTGPAGATGPQGPIGLTGPAGADGAIGPQGPIGLTGPAGAAGAQGETGPGFTNAVVDDQGILLLTKTDGGILNVGNVKGQDGAIGPQGPIGLTGPAGPAGPQGPSGTIGNLTDGHILVGDANNIPQDVAMFGDASINSLGQLLINSGAVTLTKMAPGPPDQIYITNNVGKAALTSFNNLGWSLTGNTGTVDGTNFIGNIDNQPINFRINNSPAGRITDASRGETTLGFRANSTTPNLFFNTSIGYQAGLSLGLGSSRNTLIGSNAGFAIGANSTRNMAIGELALPNLTSGNNNMGMGQSAGTLLTSGNANVFLGAGSGLTSLGSANSLVLVGDNATASSGLTNAIALGAAASVTQSNSLVLGGVAGSAVNVGIGLTAPLSKLHMFDGHIRVDQTRPPNASFFVNLGLTSVNIAPNSSDTRGEIDLIGTTNAFGGVYGVVFVTYSIQASSGSKPVVMITPGNAAAAACDYHVIPGGNVFALSFRGRTGNVTDPIFYYMTMD